MNLYGVAGRPILHSKSPLIHSHIFGRSGSSSCVRVSAESPKELADFIPIEEPLRRLGAECFARNGFPPVHVRGPLRGGQCLVDASLSSQFLSGLLFALPLAEKSSTVRVSALSSKPYIDMTRSVLKDFGIGIAADGGREFRIDSPQEFRPCEYRVEGDWSGAAFLLVAGAAAGRVRVANARRDHRIAMALAVAGLASEDGISVTGCEFVSKSYPKFYRDLVRLGANIHE